MNKIIPVFYSEYGRYISRFRAIPSYIDALKPVERRILLTLHEVARKTVKSATVVGHALGHYHPHGDTSCYNTLVNMADQGYAKGEGNWGSPGLEDAPASPYRYTEVFINKWVEEMTFQYLDPKFVMYDEFELEPEPVYLPSPIPIGLIGHGVITGISFYRTLIPKYKLSDLAKRLTWILSGKKAKDEIIIQPNSKDCSVQEVEPGEFKKILTNGTGSINYIPHGKVDNKYIRIQGRSPNTSFDSLIKAQDALDISLFDESADTLDVVVEPKKRGINLTNLGTTIWQDYLITKLNFSCLFCDNVGTVTAYGIDDILQYNYDLWKHSVLLKFIDDFDKLSNKKLELMIVQIIRYIFEQYKCHKIEEIIDRFKELKKNSEISIEIEMFDNETKHWKKETKQIEEKDIIDVCNKRTIKNLIETTIDIQKVDSELTIAKFHINNCETSCFNHVKELTKL